MTAQLILKVFTLLSTIYPAAITSLLLSALLVFDISVALAKLSIISFSCINMVEFSRLFVC